MSMIHVERISRRDAARRRAKIIQLVGGDETVFFERARRDLLSADELALYDELNGLDFLLGA